MNKFTNVEDSINEIKKPLKKIAISGFIASISVVILGICINMREENREFTSFEACFYGMKGLFLNNPSEELFHASVIKGVQGKNFKIEKITLVKLIDGYTCDVIVRDAKGHRSYRVKLEKNSKFPHLYRIADVRGQKIVSVYQWRSRL